MATFNCFEDIEAWQNGRTLTNSIYKITGSGAFARDFGLREQIRKAGVSVMSNIAEGFERGGAKEFIQFLSVSKGSVGEVKSQLFVALDQGYINNVLFDQIYSSATQTGKLIAGLMNYLKKSGIKGSKYKE
ncbi:MAG: four helix bundle protein [bacterium]|nr:four helix bundle protein [bacterium]